MSYVIKAVLSNPSHPEYGQITVPFPVPNNEYDQLIEKLEAMEIGDPLKQDCRVDGVGSFYTVISDFSKLERVGRDHAMNRNDGTMPLEELKALDGRKTALWLIGTGAGTVTPYGVVYDNGMRLEPLYDGRHFPGYLYEPPVLTLEVSTTHSGLTGVLCLPMSDRQLQRLRVQEEGGQFTEYGYVAYHGAMTLDALMHSDSADQHQQEQRLGMWDLS